MTAATISALLGIFIFSTVSFALQYPERHYGCPPGKNACIYPIDDANLQFLVRFDFQVSVDVKNDTKLPSNWPSLVSIKIELPNGKTYTPQSLWNVKPELRTWSLQAFEDSADETPEGYDSYTQTFRNVRFYHRHLVGQATVTVDFMGVTTVVKYILRKQTRRRARNVVLFVGDGMALPMMAAARLVSRGMVHGKYQDKLYMEKFPFFALQNPSGVDSIITDSANSAASLNTGHKSSVNALNVYADSSDDNFGHPKVESIAEHIKNRFNMSVGVVTTAEIQDATPAAVWSHTRRRSEKAAITAQAIKPCVDCLFAVKPDVIMGGGGRYFLPSDSIDGRNWYDVYAEEGYTVTHTRQEMMQAANNPDTEKLLTISHYGNMEVWLDRNVYTDNMNVSENSPLGDGVPPVNQPNLDEMVMSAIEILSRNEHGFYLMVEAASIDKSAHPLDIPRTLSDLIELDNTVKKVQDWAQRNGDDTLIIATADHGHGFDVFGTVDTEIWDLVKTSEKNPVSDVKHMCSDVTDNAGTVYKRYLDPDTKSPVREAAYARRAAVGTYNGAGYPDYVDSDGDNFPDTWDVRTVLAAGMNNFPDHTEDYRVSKSIKVPSVFSVAASAFVNNPEDDVNGIYLPGNLGPFGSTGVHTLQDVGVFAYGPGAELVGGNIDNTEIYHIMASALGFGTNGTIDEDYHVFGDFVRCINTNKRCHCAEVGEATTCSCRRYGPTVYLKGSSPMCYKVNGKPVLSPYDDGDDHDEDDDM